MVNFQQNFTLVQLPYSKEIEPRYILHWTLTFFFTSLFNQDTIFSPFTTNQTPDQVFILRIEFQQQFRLSISKSAGFSIPFCFSFDYSEPRFDFDETC